MLDAKQGIENYSGVTNGEVFLTRSSISKERHCKDKILARNQGKFTVTVNTTVLLFL